MALIDASMRKHLLALVIAACACGLIAVGNQSRPPPDHVRDELQVMVPVPLQILAAFGDRYLAANIGTWRATMVGAHKLSADELAAVAQVQESAAWLNPGNEDNYYMATAILPWAGEVDATQRILALASDARPHDVYAPFFYGFNAIQFRGDFVTANRYGLLAASRAESPGDQQALTVISARWSERTDDNEMAQRMVQQMARETRDPALRDYLQLRVKRLEGLGKLRAATKRYEVRYNKPLEQLDQLVSSGILEQLPTDPLGGGYTLVNHYPVLRPL